MDIDNREGLLTRWPTRELQGCKVVAPLVGSRELPRAFGEVQDDRNRCTSELIG